MLSHRIARELRLRGHDVVAVTERPELIGRDDAELIAGMVVERRAIVTHDVGDFERIHERLVAGEEEHYGMVFIRDRTRPPDKPAVRHWVDVIGALLEAFPRDDALRNRLYLVR